MSNPNPLVSAARAPCWLCWLGLAALAGYAFFLATNTSVVAGGSDSSGYLNSGRLLASGRLLTDVRAPAEFGPAANLDRMHFLPQGFFPYASTPQFTPTYPTGLPLHFAAAGTLFGWQAGPMIVLVCAAVGAVWLVYAVARELGLSPSLAAAGAVTLAVFPVFLFASVQPLSDTLATTWALAALWTALRARSARRWAIACGAALAFAVLVRPTSLLLAPALLVVLGLDWRRLTLFGLGGIPGALWLATYNHTLYGSALRSGYGDIFSAFASTYGAPTALHFAKWLALFLPAVLLALPFAAIARRDLRRRELLGLALAFGAITGLYAFYEVSHEVWWCLRFILPAVPALILAGLLGVEALARGPGARWPRAFRHAAALLIAGWAVGNSWYWTRHLGVLWTKRYESSYAAGSLATRDRLPPNAIVVCCAFSGSLYYYTDLAVLRWDQLEAPAFARYVALAQKASRPVCAVLFDSEENDALRQHCPGRWTRLATVANVGLWQLSADPGTPAQ